MDFIFSDRLYADLKLALKQLAEEEQRRQEALNDEFLDL
jgi:hypothetical protein